MDNKLLLAFVGMPGSGKSEATSYFAHKNIPYVRFGHVTEHELLARNLSVNAQNEQHIREDLRKKFGMDIYAVRSRQKIEDMLSTNRVVGIDGLYSWEEYVYLKKLFPFLTLITLYAKPSVRYERLAKRSVRPFTKEQAQTRDITEIENLNKGGPIAISDYVIVNNSTKEELHKKLEELAKEFEL